MKEYSVTSQGSQETLNGNIEGISPNGPMSQKIKKSRHARQENIAGIIMGGIPILGRLLFTFIPIAMAIAMAFFHMPKINSFKGSDWVWFDNFSYVVKDPKFWDAMKNTLIYMISLPFALAISLVLAAVLNSEMKAKGIIRVILMIPFICSTVAIVFVFKRMYDTNYGVLNALLGTNIGWITQSAGMFRLSLIIMMIWSGCGYRMLLLTASLSSVNVSYYEAAEIDGAGALKKFFNITLPAITPTLFYLLVTGCVGSLQVFGESQVMASDGGSGVGYAGVTIVFYLYREGFQYYNMGTASAAALILSGIIIIITILNFKLSNKWVRYD